MKRYMDVGEFADTRDLIWLHPVEVLEFSRIGRLISNRLIRTYTSTHCHSQRHTDSCVANTQYSQNTNQNTQHQLYSSTRSFTRSQSQYRAAYVNASGRISLGPSGKPRDGRLIKVPEHRSEKFRLRLREALERDGGRSRRGSLTVCEIASMMAGSISNSAREDAVP